MAEQESGKQVAVLIFQYGVKAFSTPIILLG